MVKKVELGGKERPLKFGFAALMEFTDATGISLQDLEKLGDDMKLSDALNLVKAGLNQGARVSGEKFDADIYDIADWLDESPGALEKILDLFAQSFTQPKK